MKNTPDRRVEVATEYPYEPLYRPWSWIFSSMFNIFLFAALVGLFYIYYRSRKNGKGKRFVTYRTVQASKQVSDRKKRTAVVTGGNGIFGGEIVRALIQDGKYEVNSLDMLIPEEDERIEGVNTYIQVDITNPDDLFLAFKDVDVVFHCGSLTPVTIRHSDCDYHEINVVGTESVIKACSECGVKRLIYTSTASVVLSKNPKITSIDSDESCSLPEDPINVYVATMGKADQLVREANGKNGLTTCVLRPSIFTEGLLYGVEEMPYYPTGLEFEVSLVSIDSAAQAHLLADKNLSESSEAPIAAGKAYNISEHKVTMQKFAEFVAAEKKTSLTYVPLSLVKFLAWINIVVHKWTGLVAISDSLTPMSVQYKSHTYVSSLARKDLGWAPGSSWEGVVKIVLKKKADEGNKKDN